VFAPGFKAQVLVNHCKYMYIDMVHLESEGTQNLKNLLKLEGCTILFLWSQVTRPFKEKSSLICHKSHWQLKRWTEIYGACSVVTIVDCQVPENLTREMPDVSWLIQVTEEILISLWKSQVTRAEE
jgi:hypothetical protein